MAITVAEINARIRAEGADQFVGDMKRAEGATTSFGSRLTRIGAGLQGAGQKMTLGVTLPIAGMVFGMVNAASDLNEATSAVSTTYGSAADLIIGKSMDAATAVGLSREQYLSAATQLGVFGDAAGLSGSALAAFGSDTIGAAADLASFYNAPVPEALEAIRAGLTGETEPLRRFGIMMSDASIQAYALENGIWDGVGAMTEQQKVLARQGFIMANMGAATGDFARTSDGLANQQRILRAEISNLAAEMGQALLPTALKLVSGFRSVLDFFLNLSPAAQRVVLVIGLVAAAIGPLLVVIGTLVGSIGTIITAFSAGGFLAPLLGMLGPIALVVAALVALGIAYKTNFLGFGDAVRAVAGWVRDGIGAVIDYIGGLIDTFRMLREQGLNPVSAALSTVARALGSIGGENTPRGIALIAQAFNLASYVITRFVSRFSGAFRKFTSGIRDIARAFRAGGITAAIDEIFGGGGAKILTAFGDVFAAIPKMIGEFLTSFTTGFEPLDNFLNTLGRMFIDVGRLIQEVFQGDWQGAFDVGKRIMARFVELIKADIDLAVALFKNLGLLVEQAITALVEKLFGIDITAFWTVFNAGVEMGFNALRTALGWLTGTAIPAIASFVQAAVGWFMDNLWPAIQTIGAAIGEFAQSAAGWISGTLWPALQDVWDAVTDFLAPFASWLLDTGIPAVQSFAQTVWSWITGTAIPGIRRIYNAISDLLQPVIDWLINTGIPGFVSFAQRVQQVGIDVRNALGDIWDFAAPKLRTLYNWLVNFVSQIAGWAASIGNTAAMIWGHLTDIWDNAKDSLQSIPNAIDDIRSGLSNLSASIGDIVQPIIDWINKIGGAFGSISWPDWLPKPGMPGKSMKSGGLDVGAIAAILKGQVSEGVASGGGAVAVPVSGMAEGLAEPFNHAAVLIQVAMNRIRSNVANAFIGMRGDIQTINISIEEKIIFQMNGWASSAQTSAEQLRANVANEFIGLRGDLTTLMEAIYTAVDGRFLVLATVARTRGGQIRANITNEFIGLRSDVTTLMQGVYTAVDGRLSVLAGVAGTRAGQIRAAVANQFVGMRSDIAAIVGSIGGVVSNALANARGAASSGAYSVGSAIGEGIQSGMNAWLSSIAATAANLVRAAVNNAHAEAGKPKSPSPVTRKRIGSPLGEGIYAGILDWALPVAGALSSMVDTPVHLAQQEISGLRWSAPSGVTATPIPRTIGGGGGNTFIVMTRSELARFFDAADVVQVLTSPEEIRAAMG